MLFQANKVFSFETANCEAVKLVAVGRRVSSSRIEVQCTSVDSTVACTGPKVAAAALIADSSRSIRVARVETQKPEFDALLSK
ncbi:MAG: hypothetical protein Q4G02_03030 [bacterium]|nr:hypothetical protein [bacterium]